jgi:hypothetical protein
MIAIPAIVFRNNVSHSAYHCQVPSASGSVKSREADLPDCEAVYPAGA